MHAVDVAVGFTQSLLHVRFGNVEFLECLGKDPAVFANQHWFPLEHCLDRGDARACSRHQ